MSTFDPVELLNYVLESHPESLGILVLNPRLQRVKFHKVMVPRKFTVEPHLTGSEEATIAKGELAMQSERRALVTFTLPERVGVNLKGPEAGRDFLIAFSIDRAVYDAFLRRREVEASGLILPPGAKI